MSQLTTPASPLTDGPEVKPPKKPPKLREFIDPAQTRQAIYDNVLQATREIEPLSNDKHRLRLEGVDWADPERFTRAERKQATLHSGTLARRLRGTWVLEDATTGQEIERRPQIVARVPYLSSAGTFLDNGSDYTVSNQPRLRPGVYARRKANGELESHLNFLSGKGVSHRYFLDPDKGLFKMRVGQSEVPLLPLLSALGATDKEVRAAWGDDLHAANYLHHDSGTLRKLSQRLLRASELQTGEQEGTTNQKLVQAIRRMELDPEVTKSTLGHPYTHLDKDVILAATNKLLRVSRGEAEPDDRDHLAYQQFFGPEDLFAERIRRDHGYLRKQAFRKISQQGSLKSMPSGLLTKQLQQVLHGSGLAQCFDAATSVLTRRGWVPWPDVVDDDEFACAIDGKLIYMQAYRVIRQDYAGTLLGCRSTRFSYLVTPNHRLWCKTTPYGEYREDRADTAHGYSRWFKTSLPEPAKCCDCDFILPAATNARHGHEMPSRVLPGDAWAAFLGWFIAEGWVNEFRVCIAQCKTANAAGCADIERVLNLLSLHWRYAAKTRNYVVNDKQLAIELLKYGHGCENKRLPRYCFEWSNRRLHLLATTYLHGDGNVYRGYVKAETTSPGLAEDLVELFGRLGGTGRSSLREQSKKNPNWSDSYVVSFGVGTETQAMSKAFSLRGGHPVVYYEQHYVGKVYCASVPGEMLYVMRDGKPHWSMNSLEEINPLEALDRQSHLTRMGEGGLPSLESAPQESRAVHPSHLNFVDMLRTPESLKAGLDVYMSRASRKGDDGRIYAPFLNKQGQTVWKSPQDVASATLATPDALRWDSKRVPVMRNGKIGYALKSDIDYVVPHYENAFSPVGNLVPLKSMVKGQRMAMASRMLTQALPLENAEAPLVQSGMPEHGGARSYDEEYGKFLGAVHADQPGRVEDIKDGVMHVRYDDGTKKAIELYDAHPMNRKTFWHQTPLLRPGESFGADQPLVRSNFTDAKGTAALGLNARVAYMAYMGQNHEDAIAISDSFAKRSASQHAYQHELEVTDKHKLGKNAYINLFPGKYDRDTLDKLDPRGLIRPGTEVAYGDPLILAARQRDHADNKLHKKGQAGFHDESRVWEHHDPGVVTDSAWGPQGPIVVVKSIAATQLGDKFAGRHGNKGIVTIVPDHEMPHDASGQPFEVLMNPAGLPSRTNPGQLAEAQLGKLAAHLGHVIKVPDFEEEKDMTEWVRDQLRQHGLSDTEHVVWPGKGGIRVPDVQTGLLYMMKLHHLAESKAQGRSGGAYTAEGAPARGGKTGCFVADTPVGVVSGSQLVQVPIQDLVNTQDSGPVLTALIRHDHLARAVRPLTDWFQYRVPATELVTILVDNGAYVTATRCHEFVLSDGTRRLASNLKVGDHLMEI